ncbi:HD domain-containing protein [Fluviispira vulneris]|uniref:HD domain-containing protein n=1 Tax=Fluviispira vulneris TaxID=2763012 RepID=UPI001C949C0D
MGWAKVKRDKEIKGNSLNEYHAVIYHLLDTGACAHEILNREPLLIENMGSPFLKIYSPKLTFLHE